MAKLREIQDDHRQSVMALTKDSQETEFIMRSPVSVYLSKLKHYTDTYKAEKKAQDKELRKANQVRKR